MVIVVSACLLFELTSTDHNNYSNALNSAHFQVLAVVVTCIMFVKPPVTFLDGIKIRSGKQLTHLEQIQ